MVWICKADGVIEKKNKTRISNKKKKQSKTRLYEINLHSHYPQFKCMGWFFTLYEKMKLCLWQIKKACCVRELQFFFPHVNCNFQPLLFLSYVPSLLTIC